MRRVAFPCNQIMMRGNRATTFENILDLGISTTEGMTCTPDREAWIAGLEFCKAEIRGIALGHELDDWLRAEQGLLL